MKLLPSRLHHTTKPATFTDLSRLYDSVSTFPKWFVDSLVGLILRKFLRQAWLDWQARKLELSIKLELMWFIF